MPRPPAAVLDDIGREIADRFLFDMLSMSRWFPEVRQLERVYSTHPAVYPVGGRKDKPVTGWSETVLARCQPYISPDFAAVKVAFDDHDLLARHGITSILNVPVAPGGRCAGTVNLMSGKVSYGAADAARLAAFVGERTSDLATAMRAVVL